MGGSIWCIYISICSNDKRQTAGHPTGRSNQDKSKSHKSQHTEGRGKCDAELAAEFQALAQKLPAEVQKCPKHWTTSLFKGLLDRYIAIIPRSSSEEENEVLRWRHARLTWWGSKV